jgi:voltage-gated potassium channel Kch
VRAVRAIAAISGLPSRFRSSARAVVTKPAYGRNVWMGLIVRRRQASLGRAVGPDDYDPFMSEEPGRRSVLSRLRDGLQNGDDGRPHFVVCGSDALVYTLAEELATTAQRVRLTVIAPRAQRPDVPDLARLPNLRVIRADRLDENTFRAAGLAGAEALALVMPDDVVNLHAALCAQAVEPDLRLVIRMFNSGLGYGVRRLFADCAVLSDARMAAPAFVAAALGEVAPTHFRYAGRTLYVARRADVHERDVVCALTGVEPAGQVTVLPAEPAAAARPTDLVLAEATGRPVGQAVAARRLVQAQRRRRPVQAIGRAVRAALNRKLGIAVLITLIITVLSGAVLVRFDNVRASGSPSTSRC